jgi:hypothetical protein
MAQTTGATGAGPILKIDYRDVVRTDVNMRTKGLNFLRREGSDIPTSNSEVDWGMVTRPNQNSRTYGTADPDSFATIGTQLGYATIKVTYRKTWTPVRIKWEVWQEAEKGAFTPAVAREMKGVAEAHAFNLERQFWTSDGNGWLFRLVTGGAADTGPTIEVDRYAGFAGEELGVIMEVLNLSGLEVSARVSDVAVPDLTGGVAIVGTITTAAAPVIKTKNAEAIVLTAGLGAPGFAANSFIYPSRQDAGNAAPGLNQSMFGLPVMVDDGTNAATYQNITVANVLSWQSQRLTAGGVKRPLTEDILSGAIAISRIRGGGVGMDEEGIVKGAFFCNIAQEEAFAQSLSTFKQFAAPTLWSLPKGYKPIAGPDVQAMAYQGIPFVAGPIALRNTVFLVDLNGYALVHNGPVEGTFWELGSGTAIPVPNSTMGEVKMWSYCNTAAEKRSSSVYIGDLQTTQAY